MTRTKNYFLTALSCMFLAALAGLVLRFAFVVELPIDYMNLRHAHGHLAMLGWIYPALFALVNFLFLPEEEREKPRYRSLFWGALLSAIGTFIGFFYQGYGGISLSFFAAHILLSYFYFFFLWRDTRKQKAPSITLLRTAMLWAVLSSAGFWVNGVIALTELGNATWYHLGAQFFLHFQLTGWFIYGALALFFKQMEDQGAQTPSRSFHLFFWSLNIATILTFALAVAWLSSHPLSYGFNALGVASQLIALFPLYWMIQNDWKERWKAFYPTVRLLYGLALGVLVLKILIQSALVVPHVAEMAHTIQNFVIGFIHLNVLGFISVFLFGTALSYGMLRSGTLPRVGIYIFLGGVFLSELLLFLQGLFFWIEIGFLPYYYRSIFIASILLPLGIGLTLFSQFSSNSSKIE